MDLAQINDASHQQDKNNTSFRVLTDEERARSRVHRDHEGLHRMQEGVRRPLEAGRYAYGVSPEGWLYAVQHNDDGKPMHGEPVREFYHSMITREPMQSAGFFDHDGSRITKIDNSSGHYRPDEIQHNLAVTGLREAGLVDDGVQVDYHVPEPQAAMPDFPPPPPGAPAAPAAATSSAVSMGGEPDELMPWRPVHLTQPAQGAGFPQPQLPTHAVAAFPASAAASSAVSMGGESDELMPRRPFHLTQPAQGAGFPQPQLPTYAAAAFPASAAASSAVSMGSESDELMPRRPFHLTEPAQGAGFSQPRVFSPLPMHLAAASPAQPGGPSLRAPHAPIRAPASLLHAAGPGSASPFTHTVNNQAEEHRRRRPEDGK